MDYGGTDRRRSKKDLKRKRLARGYKRGGKFRTHNVNEIKEEQEEGSKNNKEKKNKKGRKGKKR